MNQYPFVSILIVNYNGRSLLKSCLSSLANQSYGRKNFEVILVDNNSSDDSISYVRDHFPWVLIERNAVNEGFTGGNSRGLKRAKGEYIVLLNTDVAVDKEWLAFLVKAARKPEVGIVSSRLRYWLPFIEMEIDSRAVPKSKVYHTIDHSPIGILIEDIICSPVERSAMVYYKSGFYDKKTSEITTRRTTGKSIVLLPFDPQKKQNTYSITLHGFESNEAIDAPVRFLVKGRVCASIQVKAFETKQLKITLETQQFEKDAIWLIQNAGNVVLSSGYGKDRGNVVVALEGERFEFYEKESPYYLKESELLSACGASCLIKRKVIDHVGFFDGYFFMYYEDVELSLRAWRAGWKIQYEPKSLGYHRHRATTGDSESSFFLGLVERNHLAVVIEHFPFSTVVIEIWLFFIRFTITLLKFVAFQFMDNEARAMIWRAKYEGRKTALLSLLRSLHVLVRNRITFQRFWPISYDKMKKLLY